MERLKAPENISLEWELWRGFGKRETIITGAALAGSAALAVLYAVLLGSGDPMAPVKAVIGVVLVIFCTISAVNKLEYNQSIADYLHKSLRFQREQQQFYYQSEEVLTPYGKKTEE